MIQLLAVQPSDGQPLGTVFCHNADFRNGHASISVQVSDEVSIKGLGSEAMRLFIDYLFGLYDFRKLYAEVYEFNLEEFAHGMDRLYTIEACFKQHELFAGKAWDRLSLAFYRDSWIRESRPLEHKLSEIPRDIEGFVDVLLDHGMLCEDPRLSGLFDWMNSPLELDSLQSLVLLDFLDEFAPGIPIEELVEVASYEDLHFLFLQFFLSK